MSKSGYTTIHWKAAIDINPPNHQNGGERTRRQELDHIMQDQGGDKDGRKASCPKCHFQFLCSQP